MFKSDKCNEKIEERSLSCKSICFLNSETKCKNLITQSVLRKHLILCSRVFQRKELIKLIANSIFKQNREK